VKRSARETAGILIVSAVLALTGGCAKSEPPPAPPPPTAPKPPPSPQSESWTAEQIAYVTEKFGPLELTATGLRYKILQPGEGDATPPRASLVTVHYRGSLLNDQVFDDSRRTNQPYRFRVGLDGRDAIKGFDEAVFAMKKGERRLAVIPYWLGYGVKGRGPRIPSRAVLVFEIELLGWETTQKIPSSQTP
jgi:FKBP-type peptidyl-prolyl cis-trans isomerase